MVATVIVNDRGAPRGPDGASRPDVAEEVRSAFAEAPLVARTGRYRSVAFEAGMDVPAGAAPALRRVNVRVAQSDGTPAGDSACVGLSRGSFVKARVTVQNPPEPTVAGLVASSLLSEVLRVRAAGR